MYLRRFSRPVDRFCHYVRTQLCDDGSSQMNTIFESPMPTPNRRPGRPSKPGSKRSNPEYRPWSGLLRGQYIRDADIVLKQTEDPRDMSDLITELLGKWVTERLRRSEGGSEEGIGITTIASEQGRIEE